MSNWDIELMYDELKYSMQQQVRDFLKKSTKEELIEFIISHIDLLRPDND